MFLPFIATGHVQGKGVVRRLQVQDLDGVGGGGDT